jgi:hypothetical protein
MAVSGHLHAPATLFHGKSPRCPFDRRLGGPQSRSGRCEGEKYLALPGIELRSSYPSLYRLCYHKLIHSVTCPVLRLTAPPLFTPPNFPFGQVGSQLRLFSDSVVAFTSYPRRYGVSKQVRSTTEGRRVSKH